METTYYDFISIYQGAINKETSINLHFMVHYYNSIKELNSTLQHPMQFTIKARQIGFAVCNRLPLNLHRQYTTGVEDVSSKDHRALTLIQELLRKFKEHNLQLQYPFYFIISYPKVITRRARQPRCIRN